MVLCVCQPSSPQDTAMYYTKANDLYILEKQMDQDKKLCSTRLSVCNLGAAVGITWGLMMFVVSFLTMLFGIGSPFVDIFSSIYWGFDATVIGSLVGFFWGLVFGYIFGALVAFFYNYCSCKCPCTSCKKDRKKSK